MAEGIALKQRRFATSTVPSNTPPGPSEATLYIDSEPEEPEKQVSTPLTECRVVPDGAEPLLSSSNYTLPRRMHQQEEDTCFSVGKDENNAIPEDDVFDFPSLEHIIDAIECGNMFVVKQWLQEKETNVNEHRGGRASHGHFFVSNGTALHWAAYYGQLEIAKLLLSKNADPYQMARGKETVLHWACQCKVKNEKLVQLLLTTSFKTADKHPQKLVNFPDCKGWTPLHYACYDSNKELVKQLLAAGADKCARNVNNFTPLDMLNENSEEVLDILDPPHLLPRKNDPVLPGDIIEKIKSEDMKGFQKWLNEGGKVNHCRGGLTIDGDFVLEGGTALHWAAYYGKRTLVEKLIEKGADPCALSWKKESVLHWACKSQQNNEDLVKYLVEKKKVCVNCVDVDGCTPLFYACLRGNLKAAQQLLHKEADKTARTVLGETPVDAAFESGENNMIELVDEEHLLPHDGDPELKADIIDAIRENEDKAIEKLKTMTKDELNHSRGGNHDSNDFEVAGGTALHWAAYYGKVEVAKKLLKRNASPKVMDQARETVLHWACKGEEENEEMVKLLLKHIKKNEGEKTKHQVNSTNNKGYTPLHYACWQGHQIVAEELMKAEADPSARSIAGYVPCDFAFVVSKNRNLVKILDSDQHLLPRAGCPQLEKCIIEGGYTGHVKKWLSGQRRNVDRCRDQDEGGTALHWAAYYGRLEIVKMLIENSANPRARAYDNGTVLHWACRSEKGSREIVRLLLKMGCKIDDRDENGYTPFHLAASHGCQRVVEELLQWDRFRVWVNYRVLAPRAAFIAKMNEGHSPLVRASLKAHHNVVKLLLKKGVKVDPQDLHDAIEEGNEHVVSDLLQSPQWPTLLRQSWKNTTPFRELIKKMPDIAKQVLDRCVVSNPDTRDPNNRDFEVVFDYSFVEDHDDGHARSSPEENKPKCYPKDKAKNHEKRFEEVKEQKTNWKYGPAFKKSNHPLQIMVQKDRLKMLTHPVISSLLNHKWFHFGLLMYLLNLLVYIIFLVFLTSFALVVLTPQSNTCLQVLSNPGIATCRNGMEGMNSTGSGDGSGDDSEPMADRNVTCVICELSSTASQFVSTSAVVVIIFAVICLFMEACQLCYEQKSYVFDWANYFEISLYILSIMFVSVFRTTCMCPLEWQWQVGVMAVLLAWINLIGFCAKFPSIGIYIIMFGRVVRTFLKVIILSILLVITFGLIFYMTFSEAQFQRSPFYQPANAMIKVMSMTAGDFEFDEIFRMSLSTEEENAGTIPFPPISYLLWIIFVIIMPILFINMLTGLAVGDINEVKKKARLTKLALRVDMILTAEHLLRVLHLYQYFGADPLSVSVTPNKTEESHTAVRFLGKAVKDLIYYLSGGEHYDAECFQRALNYYLDSESEDQSEMTEHLQEHIKETKQEMSHQMQQMAEHAKEHIKESKLELSHQMEQMTERAKEHIKESKLELSHQMKQMAEHAKEHIKRSKLEMSHQMEQHLQEIKKEHIRALESVKQMMEERMKALEKVITEAVLQKQET